MDIRQFFGGGSTNKTLSDENSLVRNAIQNNTMNSTFLIYVLFLKENKYYVGKTKNRENILEQYKLKRECEWTNKYAPIYLIDSFESSNIIDENNTIKHYIIKYGLQNVRGDSFSQIILEDFQINAIEDDIQNIGDKCSRCGE